MKIKVIITGATGMVGEGVLQECITNSKVEKILLVNRKPSGYTHPKVEELIHSDLSDLSSVSEKIKGFDACFFCAGTSSVGKSEEEYTKITYDMTLGFATDFASQNPKMTFCYVSGSGTDSTENGKQMWARVKGRTENDLMKLDLKVYNFRPAFMKPSEGAKNVNGIYKAINALFPIFRLFSKTYFLTLEEVGKAMISTTLSGYSKSILEVRDISIQSMK